jgi:hypothetical protein
MKQQLKKWTFRLVFMGAFLLGLLVMFMLFPVLLYAHKTQFGNYAVYHDKPIPENFLVLLEHSVSLIKSSELYDPGLKMEICLKDGAPYPGLVETFLGKDLISSFYNKLVITADSLSFDSNYISLDGHKWNLEAMLAHGQVHSMEFNKYGFWKSNPIGKHPAWKWEGYPEYIARANKGNKNLCAGIKTLLETASGDHTGNTGWMSLPDGTETLTLYFGYRLLVQYCIEIRKTSFAQLLEEGTPEETIRQQMMDWYKGAKAAF